MHYNKNVFFWLTMKYKQLTVLATYFVFPILSLISLSFYKAKKQLIVGSLLTVYECEDELFLSEQNWEKFNFSPLDWPILIVLMSEYAYTYHFAYTHADDRPLCVELREIHPYIECCENDTMFCPIQCRRTKCKCIDPETGEIVGNGLHFYKNDPCIDCVNSKYC